MIKIEFQITVIEEKNIYEVEISTNLDETPIKFRVEKQSFEIDLRRIFTESRDYLLALDTITTFQSKTKEIPAYKGEPL